MPGSKDGYRGDYGDVEIGEKVLIEYPLHLTRECNECFLGLIIGMPGRGKTWAALRLAEKLDPTFDIDRLCVTYGEFLGKLKELANAWDRGDDVAGKVLIFDEFQKGASARKFMSTVNQAITSVLHTFRYLNLIVIFTTPHLSFVDVNARAVMHFQVTMKEKNREMGMSRGELSFTEIKNNFENPSDKLYHFAPRIFTDEGTLCVRSVWFEKPSARIQRLADDKVSSFKSDVLTESIADTERYEQKETAVQKTKAQLVRELANEIYVNKGRFYDERRGKWDKGAIMLSYPALTNGKVDAIRPLLDAMIKFNVKVEDLQLPEE